MNFRGKDLNSGKDYNQLDFDFEKDDFNHASYFCQDMNYIWFQDFNKTEFQTLAFDAIVLIHLFYN